MIVLTGTTIDNTDSSHDHDVQNNVMVVMELASLTAIQIVIVLERRLCVYDGSTTLTTEAHHVPEKYGRRQ